MTDRWRVVRALADEFSREFEYGSTDCVQLAAESVMRLAGVDYRKEYPDYDEQGAQAILEDVGGMHALMSRHLGDTIDIDDADDADVALVDIAGHELFGLIAGDGVIVMTERGLVKLLRSSVKHVWRVTPCHQ